MRILILAPALLLACAATFAQANPPPAKPGGTALPSATLQLPTDRHEGLSISADPYVDKARCKEKFGKADPLPIGVLPIEIFIRNESAQTIRVKLETIQLEIRHASGSRQDIDWLTADEVAKFIAHPGGAKTPSQRRLPVPVVRNNKDKNVQKLMEILQPLTLDADIMAPKQTLHGFLYFNVNHDTTVLKHATLYVPDVTVAPSNKVLMFFEVPLGSSE
jgi:hypothetical protein